MKAEFEARRNRAGQSDASSKYQQFGSKPHYDGDRGHFRTTDDGFVADEAGNPVVWPTQGAAAKWAARFKMGGDFELQAHGTSTRGGEQPVTLQRKPGSVYGQTAEDHGAAPQQGEAPRLEHVQWDEAPPEAPAADVKDEQPKGEEAGEPPVAEPAEGEGVANERTAKAERYHDKMWDLEVDGDKKAARRFADKLRKEGVIDDADHAEVKRILSDKDMDVEDATSELKSMVDQWHEHGQPNRKMGAEAAAEAPQGDGVYRGPERPVRSDAPAGKPRERSSINDIHAEAGARARSGEYDYREQSDGSHDVVDVPREKYEQQRKDYNLHRSNKEPRMTGKEGPALDTVIDRERRKDNEPRLSREQKAAVDQSRADFNEAIDRAKADYPKTKGKEVTVAFKTPRGQETRFTVEHSPPALDRLRERIAKTPDHALYSEDHGIGETGAQDHPRAVGPGYDTFRDLPRNAHPRGRA
jgi:hypothetical protein